MPIPDSTDSWLRGIQIGADLVNNAMAQRARVQDLKSQEALRRVQERAAVQQMARLFEEHQRKIEYAAAMEKAVGAANIAMSPVIPVPGFGVMPNPNPLTDTQAAMRFVLPTIAKFEPEKVQPAMEGIALTEARRAAEARMEKSLTTARPLAPEQSVLLQAKTDTEKARQKELEARATGGATFAPSDIQKKLEYFERRGITLTREELEKVARVTIGVDPRPGTEEARGDAIMRVFTMLRQNRPKGDTDGLILRDARRLVDAIYEDNALGSNSQIKKDNSPGRTSPSSGKIITVISPNGQIGTIPEEDLEKALKKNYKLYDANAKQ
jgi:hypothetical protein